MGFIYPKITKEEINAAEWEVYKKFELGLPEEIVCYHNSEVQNMETDFIVMLPGEGIVVIEVKSWNGARITRLLDSQRVEYFDQNNQRQIAYSPLKQCKKYTYALRASIKETFNKSIKVVPLVCLPFMTEDMYIQKQIQIMIPRERIILKDDLEKISEISFIIKKKFNQKEVGKTDLFNQDLYVKIISEWFEPKEELIKRMERYTPSRKIKRIFHKRDYSILTYLKIDLDQPYELIKTQLHYYFEKWIVGTKIILIVDNCEQQKVIMKYIEHQIEEELDYLLVYEDFKVYDTEKGEYRSAIFHFDVHTITQEDEFEKEYEPFTLINGEKHDQWHEILTDFDERSTFNYKQYRIEHTPKQENVLIKAGAGTGKTYSMIARISYLYYINKYIPEDLLKAIVMITFTNEAADNMKKRLKTYFTNLALLTEETSYIHIMENISRMQISTIHSLMKKIIVANSKYLGVGQTIKITTEKYEKQNQIHDTFNVLSTQEKYKHIIERFKKYELRKAVEKFIDLLEKKNINLEYAAQFDCVEKESILFDFILEAATEVQKKSIEKHIKQNKVNLSNLALYIQKILNIIEGEHLGQKINRDIEYVFIDEFQDTDDMTIELIKRFYKLLEFKLFVVGDIKQSIYRFRGADDEAFDKLKRGIESWVSDPHNGLDYLTLNKNYRSDKVLLEQFHKLFMSWENGIHSFSEVLKYDNSDRLVGVNRDIRIKQPIQSKEYTATNFETILVDTIRSKLDDLDDKYSDKINQKGKIAILTRNNQEVEEVRQIGERHGYIIETHKVENLYQMAPTKDLYRLILALQFNTNPKYLYSLSLSNYAPTISKKDVYKNRIDRQHIYNLFRDNKVISNWTTVVQQINRVEEDMSIMESLRQKTILRVIREINQQTKPWARYAAQFSSDKQQEHREHYKRNQDLLIERLIKMSSGDYLTINNLAKYLHIMIFTNQHEDERAHRTKTTEHKIQCLTVHKSKGMEYDHVIIPYTNTPLDQAYGSQVIVIDGVIYTKLVVKKKEKGKKQKGVAVVSKNFYSKTVKEKEDLVKEEARILYVALTRAEDTVTWFDKIDEKIGNKENVTWTELLKKMGGNHDEQ